MGSPWGQIDHVQSLCHGVSFVSTPSHGGLRVSKKFAENNLSQAALSRAIRQGNYYFWEEDCAFAMPMLELPMIWDLVFPNTTMEKVQQKLMSTISNYNPEYLLERNIQPYEKEYNNWKRYKERDERRLNEDPDLIISAVSVYTEEGELVKVTTADGKTHYVSKESYSSSVLSILSLLSECQVVDYNGLGE